MQSKISMTVIVARLRTEIHEAGEMAIAEA